jgi:hypothetical protein
MANELPQVNLELLRSNTGRAQAVANLIGEYQFSEDQVENAITFFEEEGSILNAARIARAVGQNERAEQFYNGVFADEELGKRYLIEIALEAGNKELAKTFLEEEAKESKADERFLSLAREVGHHDILRAGLREHTERMFENGYIGRIEETLADEDFKDPELLRIVDQGLDKVIESEEYKKRSDGERIVLKIAELAGLKGPVVKMLAHSGEYLKAFETAQATGLTDLVLGVHLESKGVLGAIQYVQANGLDEKTLEILKDKISANDSASLAFKLGINENTLTLLTENGALYMAAKLFEEAGRTDDAIKLYLEGDNFFGSLSAVKLAKQAEKYDLAFKIYFNMGVNHGLNPANKNQLLELVKEQGLEKKLDSELRKAIEVVDEDNMKTLAEFASDIGRDDLVVDLYRRLMEQRGDSYFALECAIKAGIHDKASELAEKKGKLLDALHYAKKTGNTERADSLYAAIKDRYVEQSNHDFPDRDKKLQASFSDLVSAATIMDDEKSIDELKRKQLRIITNDRYVITARIRWVEASGFTEEADELRKEHVAMYEEGIRGFGNYIQVVESAIKIGRKDVFETLYAEIEQNHTRHLTDWDEYLVANVEALGLVDKALNVCEGHLWFDKAAKIAESDGRPEQAQVYRAISEARTN